MSRRDLEQGQFIEWDIEKLDAVADLPAYQSRREAWRETFLKKDECSFCPAWRICLGKFGSIPGSRPACEKFFMECLDAAEHHLSLRMKSTKVIRSPWNA